MKLLVEQSFDVQPLHEEVNGKKQLFIEGVFMQSNVINRNKRRYDKDTMMVPSVDKYIAEYVAQRRGIGELKHPTYPIPDIEKAALLTTELKWDGDNVVGKALVLDTPQGNILRGLLEGGFNMGMSTRSLGTLQSNEGYSDVTSLIINAIDAVDMPSGPDCYVNPVNESINWVQTQVGSWIEQAELQSRQPVSIGDLQQFVEDAISKLKKGSN